MMAIVALAGAAYLATVPKDTPPVSTPRQGQEDRALHPPPVKDAEAPSPARSGDHRKAHRLAPKVAKEKIEPRTPARPAPSAAPDKRKRAMPLKKSKAKPALPSCAVIRARRDSMSLSEQLAAYSRATPEEVAYGRRCLGL